MAHDSLHRYRSWYARLLRLHPRAHYTRFGEGMEQTFTDLLRERAQRGAGLFTFACWVYVETSAGIISQHVHHMSMQKRTITFVLGALAVLIVPLAASLANVEGFNWNGTDFLVAGVLLVAFGLALSVATNTAIPLARRAVGFGFVGLVLLAYVHLAVGIVDWLPFAGS